MRLTLAIAIALAVLAAAGCGSDGDDGESAQVPRGRDPPVGRHAALPATCGGAAEFFALPSAVANGTPPVTLHTRADVRLFNESLPCGARLLRTSSSSGFITAVFRLTERPGPGSCGSGTGGTARTTFVIRDGKIQEWRRVADEPAPGGPIV